MGWVSISAVAGRGTLRPSLCSAAVLHFVGGRSHEWGVLAPALAYDPRGQWVLGPLRASAGVQGRSILQRVRCTVGVRVRVRALHEQFRRRRRPDRGHAVAHDSHSGHRPGDHGTFFTTER